MILGTSLSAEYRKVVALMQQRRVPAFEAEEAVFGASRAEVGPYLIGLWGLPDSIVEAVAYRIAQWRSACATLRALPERP